MQFSGCDLPVPVCALCKQVNDHPYECCPFFTRSELAVFLERRDAVGAMAVFKHTDWTAATLFELKCFVQAVTGHKFDDFELFSQPDLSRSLEDAAAAATTARHDKEANSAGKRGGGGRGFFERAVPPANPLSMLLSDLGVAPGGFVMSALRVGNETTGGDPPAVAMHAADDYDVATVKYLRQFEHQCRRRRQLAAEVAPSRPEPGNRAASAIGAHPHGTSRHDHDFALAAQQDDAGVDVPEGQAFDKLRRIMGHASRWADAGSTSGSHPSIGESTAATAGAIAGLPEADLRQVTAQRHSRYHDPTTAVPFATAEAARATADTEDESKSTTKPTASVGRRSRDERSAESYATALRASMKPTAAASEPTTAGRAATESGRNVVIRHDRADKKDPEGHRRGKVATDRRIDAHGRRHDAAEDQPASAMPAQHQQLQAQDRLAGFRRAAGAKDETYDRNIPRAPAMTMASHAEAIDADIPLSGVPPDESDDTIRLALMGDRVEAIQRTVNIHFIPNSYTERRVAQVVRRWGEPLRVRLFVRPLNPRLIHSEKGFTYAFVEFATVEAAERCVAESNTVRAEVFFLRTQLATKPIISRQRDDARLESDHISVVRCSLLLQVPDLHEATTTVSVGVLPATHVAVAASPLEAAAFHSSEKKQSSPPLVTTKKHHGGGGEQQPPQKAGQQQPSSTATTHPSAAASSGALLPTTPSLITPLQRSIALVDGRCVVTTRTPASLAPATPATVARLASPQLLSPIAASAMGTPIPAPRTMPRHHHHTATSASTGGVTDSSRGSATGSPQLAGSSASSASPSKSTPPMDPLRSRLESLLVRRRAAFHASEVASPDQMAPKRALMLVDMQLLDVACRIYFENPTHAYYGCAITYGNNVLTSPAASCAERISTYTKQLALHLRQRNEGDAVKSAFDAFQCHSVAHRIDPASRSPPATLQTADMVHVAIELNLLVTVALLLEVADAALAREFFRKAMGKAAWFSFGLETVVDTRRIAEGDAGTLREACFPGVNDPVAATLCGLMQLQIYSVKY